MNIVNANCLDAMRDMPASSVDAIVTDPPYGLSFMGKDWDHGVPGVAFWQEALRVAKPGAHLLAFGGTRTYHRLAFAIEDAGWEIRDCIMWVYGSGFPKSMDVAKAIDKANGYEGEVIGERTVDVGMQGGNMHAGRMRRQQQQQIHALSPEAEVWSGWGTALKPAVEPIIVARKPLEGTVAANVLEYGTGAINIDGCRVPTFSDGPWSTPKSSVCGRRNSMAGDMDRVEYDNTKGRFPANLVHDGSPEVLALFPEGTGASAPLKGTEPSRTGAHGIYNAYGPHAPFVLHDARGGSAARFFYCAKAARSERGEGNDHPTVKPVALMRWLVRLVCRPGGLVLDPFCGSGTTGVACREEGMDFIGIEKNEGYFKIARNRVLGNGDTAPFQMEIPFG